MTSFVRCPQHPDTPVIGQCAECEKVFCSRCAHFSEGLWFCSARCARQDRHRKLGIQLREAQRELALYDGHWNKLRGVVSIISLLAILGVFIGMAIYGANYQPVFQNDYLALAAAMMSIVLVFLLIVLPCSAINITILLVRKRKLSRVKNLEFQLQEFADE